jgi:hypothetical protein
MLGEQNNFSRASTARGAITILLLIGLGAGRSSPSSGYR